MKVSELLEGDYDDERGEYYPSNTEQRGMDSADESVKEYFHENYIEIDAAVSVGFDELEDIIRDVVNKQRDANLQQELEILSKFGDMAEQGDYYVPRSEAEKLDELDDVIANAEIPTQTAGAIKEFLSILNRSMTTFEDWMDSEEANDVGTEARSDFTQGEEDPYTQRGLKRSDFY